jgi:hypothetical protein
MSISAARGTTYEITICAIFRWSESNITKYLHTNAAYGWNGSKITMQPQTRGNAQIVEDYEMCLRK